MHTANTLSARRDLAVYREGEHHHVYIGRPLTGSHYSTRGAVSRLTFPVEGGVRRLLARLKAAMVR